MFRDRTIEKRVMGQVQAAIDEAQANLDRDAASLADSLIADLKAVHDMHAAKAEALTQSHVRSVFVKLA